MATFQQPSRRGRSSDPYDESGIQESAPLPAGGSDVSDRAQQTLDNIDSVLGAGGLKKAEVAGADGKTGAPAAQGAEGSLWRDEGQGGGGKLKKIAKSLMSGNKRKLIGGGVVGGSIASAIISLIMLAPLKILHVVNNLQSQFFAGAEQATEDMTDRYLRAYIVKKVMPGMIDGKCTSTRVSNNCVQITNGSGIVGILYNGWRDGKIEQKLATKHGIVIERNGNKFKLVTPTTLRAGGIELGSFNATDAGEMDRSLYKAMNRGDVRREVRKATEAETFAKRVMYRYKYGHYLERKHGIARCLIACNLKDRYSDNVDAKKAAFKSYFVKRVVLPRSEMLGIAMLCAINGFSCTDPPDEPDEDGKRETEAEKDTREAVIAGMAGAREAGDLDKVHADSEEIRRDGFATFMATKVLPEMVVKIGGRAIPIVGWIDLAANLNHGARKAGEAAKHLNYVINAAAMVTTYSMFRSQADELKKGDIDANAQGSVIQAFDPTDGTERKDQGGVGAESSPLYQKLMGSDPTRTGLLGTPKVYAASSYACDDGKPIPDDKLICPEETLLNDRTLAEGAEFLSLIYNSPPFKGVGVAADLWIATVGAALDWIFGKVSDLLLEPFFALLGKITPDSLEEWVGKLAKSIIEYLISFMINNPISDNPSGARMFNLAAGGANVAGNDFTHYNLGAASASDQAVNNLRQERFAQQLEDFKQESIMARVFDTSSQFSMVSRLAVSLPSSGSGLVQNSLASMFNPYKIFGGLGRVGGVSAADLDEDPFGVTQYMYEQDHPVFLDDPEESWKKYDCDNPDQIKEWGKQSETNEETGMQEHSTPNPCMLLKSAAGSAGAVFTDDVLSADELGIDAGDDSDLPRTGKLCTIPSAGKDRTELSGLAASQKHSGIVYTHDDEGNKIYAVDIETCAVAGTFTVNGTREDPDPEAIQVDHSTGKIWFGDIGNGHPEQPSSWTDKDRGLKYPSLPARIVVFSEPSQLSGDIKSAQAIDITYPGRNENSEALLVNPKTGQGYIINKAPTTKVFKLPHPIASGQATNTGAQIVGWVTDATFTNDGKWVLVRYRTNDPAPTKVDVYDARTWKKAGEIEVPKVPQGESITAEKNGISFLIGSEGNNSPLVRVLLPPEFGGPNVGAGKLDLKSWKVTLPICDGDEAKEIKQPELDKYIAAGGSEWFKKTSEGLDFYVNSSGACTTGGSDNPRSELREMNADGSNEYQWNPSSGTHRMLIRQTVKELALKGDSAGVVIGQIHEYENKDIDDYTVFRLEGKNLYAFIDGKKSKSKVIDSNFQLNKPVTLGFSVENGTVNFLYDRNGGSKPPVVHSVGYPSGGKAAYFKAGNYCQCGSKGRSGSTRVVIHALGVTHDGSMPAIAGLGRSSILEEADSSYFGFGSMSLSRVSCKSIVPRLFSSFSFMPTSRGSGSCS